MESVLITRSHHGIGFEGDLSTSVTTLVTLLLSRHVAVGVLFLICIFKVLKDANLLSSAKFGVVDALPGPATLPVFGVVHLVNESRDILKLMSRLVREYGAITKIKLFSARYVILNSAPHVQALLSSNNLGHLTKSPLVYKVTLGDALGIGLLTSSGHHWSLHRRLLSRAFTYKALRFYTGTIFNRFSRKLVANLEAIYDEKESAKVKVNGKDEPLYQLNTLLNCCSIGIISQTVMGLDSEHHIEDAAKFYENIRRTKLLTSERERAPWLLFDFLWQLHPASKKYYTAVETMNSVVRRMISKHRIAKSVELEGAEDCNEDDKREPFTNMIELMHSAGMKEEDILSEVKTMITAGFETSAATSHFLLFMLALHQDRQRECREEIDAIFEDPGKCDQGNLSYDALMDMKCLERCILETLRLYPVALSYVRKLESPLKLDDKLTLPVDTHVAVFTFTLHKNPEYFPNPEKFDPDRFLAENCTARHQYAYVPFSAGPRNCVGYKFALAETKTMVAHILRHFEVSTIDKIDDVALLPSVLLTPSRDYNFLLRKRTHISSHTHQT